MTKGKFSAQDDHLWFKYNQLKEEAERAWQERQALQEAYAKEALEASGYAIGQKVFDNEGQL